MSFKKSSIYLVGTEDTPVTLTGSYVEGTPVFVGEAEQIGLDVAYTMGSGESGNSVELRVEFSGDNSTGSAPTEWYQEVTESVASGTITETLAERTFSAVSAAGTYDRFRIPLPIDAKWIRISVKETGIAANGGLITIKGTTYINE